MRLYSFSRWAGAVDHCQKGNCSDPLRPMTAVSSALKNWEGNNTISAAEIRREAFCLPFHLHFTIGKSRAFMIQYIERFEVSIINAVDDRIKSFIAPNVPCNKRFELGT